MRDAQKDVILLIKNALLGTGAPISSQPDWEQIYLIAVKHQIIPLVYYGLLNTPCQLPEKTRKILEIKTFKYVAQSEKQIGALKRLEAAFESNGIDYLPLKGAVLKFIYPQTEMRTMCDVDILIHVEQRSMFTPLMEKMGYTLVSEADHELVWHSGNSLYVELHKRLIPSRNRNFFECYSDGWGLARQAKPGSCRYELRPEDELIYLIVHFSKHYSNGGVGIKHILDLWVYRRKNAQLDRKYVEEQLEKLGYATFYRNVMHTIDVWFEDAPPDEMSEFLTNHIMESGSFGSTKTLVLANAGQNYKTKSVIRIRAGRICTLVFLPYRNMKKKYPVLSKAPILLPIYWVVRWFSAAFFGKKAIRREADSLKLLTTKNIEQYQQDLMYVGLNEKLLQ